MQNMDEFDIGALELDLGERKPGRYKELIDKLVELLGKPDPNYPQTVYAKAFDVEAIPGKAIVLRPPPPLYTTPLVDPPPKLRYVLIHLHRNKKTDVFLRIRTHDVYLIAYGVKTTTESETKIAWKELRDGDKEEPEIEGSELLHFGCSYPALASVCDPAVCTFTWDDLDRALYSLADRNESEKGWKKVKRALVTFMVTFAESARFKPIFNGIFRVLYGSEMPEYKISRRDRHLINSWGDISDLRASEERHSSPFKAKLHTTFGEAEDLVALMKDLGLGNGTALGKEDLAKRQDLENEQEQRRLRRQRQDLEKEQEQRQLRRQTV